ncbi:MAG: hypothetical protein ABIR18_04355, partial [Chitinophagaceae bacterium]
MEDQINSNKSEIWSLSVKDLFYKYVRFLPLFLLSLALALLIGWVYLRYSTRIYGAAGVMLIKNEAQGQRNDKVEDILAGNNRSQNILNEIEILRSRPLMERVVNRLQLQFNYVAQGKIKEMNIYKQSPFIMEAFVINDSTRTFTTKIKFISDDVFRINNEPKNFTYGQLLTNANGIFRLVKNGQVAAGNEFIITWQPAETVAAGLVGNIKVQPKTPGTGMLSVSIQTTNPQMAADIVNNLMVQYDSLTVEQNNFSTDQMLNFVDDRIRILTHELDSIQQILLAYQQKNNLVDIEAQSASYFEKMTLADKAVYDQILKLDVVELLNDYLADKKNQYSRVVVPSSLGLQDVTLNELVSAYNKGQLERQALIDGNVPLENPIVKELEGQVEKLRE